MNKFIRKRIPAIFFALAILLSSLAVPVMPARATSVTSLKSHLNIGYWLGGNGGSKKTLAEANQGWDVINVSFIETRGNYYTPHLTMDLSAVYSGTEEEQAEAFKKDVKTLQAQGKKIVISCGGQNGVVHLDNAQQRDTFLKGVKAIIDEYGFDGFDVDFEGSSIACMNTDKIGNLVTQQSINLEYILRDLKKTYGSDFIISAAPEYCYVQGGAISSGNYGAFLPVLDACRDILTYIHPQYYNGFNGDFSWLQPSANAGAAFAQVYSEEGYIRLSEMLITGFVAEGKGTFEGLRPDQVAFGVPARAGAGNGAQSVSVYASALKALIEKYPSFRGVMTWSVGWDESGGDKFVNAIAPIIAAANGQTTQVTNAQTPVITSQPSDISAKVNDTAVLKVEASVSKGALSYQWYKALNKVNTGGTAINGATGATYNVPTGTTGISYYYCVITNTDNSATGSKTATVTSKVAALEVSAQSLTDAAVPGIVSQPSDMSVKVNDTATLKVEATVSKGTLSYQWYKASNKVNTGGTAISGATGASYSAPTGTAGTSYYYCVITNTDNSATGNKTATVTSKVAALEVSAQSLTNAVAPNITSQPSDITIKVGDTAALSVAANVSKGTLSYQWYKASSKVNTGGTAISGATGASYSAPTGTAGTSYYYCVITNTDNSATGNKTSVSVSNAVSVTVNASVEADTWNANTVYVGGQTVIYEGQTYLCKWWTLGEIPSKSGPWGPWKLQ